LLAHVSARYSLHGAIAKPVPHEKISFTNDWIRKSILSSPATRFGVRFTSGTL
jgi:hypothetical protein